MAETTALDQTLIDRIAEDAREVWPDNFADIEEMFNRCCFAIAVAAMRSFGLFGSKGDTETFDTIRTKVKLFKDAEYVTKHLLRILVDEGMLERQGESWVCVDPDPYVETPAESLVTATRSFPEEGAPFQWLARAADGLVAFMKGELYAEEVMFPQGSFKLVEEVYNTSNVYGFYSRLAAKAIKRLLEARDGPVTMLEVGAGTGNGTANVLGQVDDRFERYVFTDVSKSLVQMGQRRFKKSGYDFLEYRTLDVCADIAAQQFEPQCADIILAVNVLHATSDIRLALRNLRPLLRPDGLLVLSEIAPPPGGIYRYMELTFGLLPSYNAYDDTDRRPVAPIIRPDEWVSAFRDAGYAAVEAIPGERWSDMDRGGIVIGSNT
ncbi:MAG: methyltransferase [Chitinivibrionales bacterium]|nr:methyltransferase [Chitinivibrionales bacterium]